MESEDYVDEYPFAHDLPATFHALQEIFKVYFYRFLESLNELERLRYLWGELSTAARV